MIMLKDNHIDYCGGIEEAIERAHDYVQRYQPHLKIEVETRSLEDVETVLRVGKGKVHRVMLDNYNPEDVKNAVHLINGVFETEAEWRYQFGYNRELCRDRCGLCECRRSSFTRPVA
jgi:nicotinate-nucleotide pyrophosphorylase (carboxylating)